MFSLAALAPIDCNLDPHAFPCRLQVILHGLTAVAVALGILLTLAVVFALYAWRKVRGGKDLP